MYKARGLVLVAILSICGFFSSIGFAAVSGDNNRYLKGISIEEYESEFWAFFLDLDPKLYDKVIKKFFGPDRSKKDHIAGVKATLSLLRKHNEIMPTSLVEQIISDEAFLNAIIWQVDDLSLKKYVLKLILLDIGISEDIVTDVFSKYSSVSSLTTEEQSLLKDVVIWYIQDQRNFLDNVRVDYASRSFGKNSFKNKLEEIRFIVKNSGWVEENSRFKTSIFDMLKKADDTETVIPTTEVPVFKLKYANTFPEMMDALDAAQVLELRRMILTKNGEELYSLLDRIDNFNLKADILRFTLSRVQKELAFDIVELVIDMYKDFDYLEDKDRALLHVTIVNAIPTLSNDQIADIVIDLESSSWFGNIAGESIMLLQLGVLSSLKVSRNDNVLIYWKKIMKNSLFHYRCSKGLRTELSSNLTLKLSPTSFVEDVKTIFTAYRDVQNLTSHDAELLSILIGYVNSLNDESISMEILGAIEGSLWLGVEKNANNEKLKSRVKLFRQSGCTTRFTE